MRFTGQENATANGGAVAMQRKQKPEKHPYKIKGIGGWKTQAGYYAMLAIPALLLLVFNYLPLAGIYMAFSDFKPVKGIFGSEWVGLKWFIQFFSSTDFTRIFTNTIYYNVLNIFLVRLVGGVVMALLLFEIRSRIGNKIFQTSMLLPSFLSWTVISAVLYMVIGSGGYLNNFLSLFGVKAPSWYSDAQAWRYLIPIAELYKNAGMASIYYFAALLSIDGELFDAAKIDGANRLQQIRHISIPAIKSVVSITLILAMGDVLTAGISPFYELTFDQGSLYDTTMVIGTFLKNGLQGGRFSYTAAVGLTESLISVIMVVAANLFVKKVDPESSLF